MTGWCVVVEPMGGTELSRERILSRLPSQVLDRFLIVSRPEHYEIGRPSVLWLQDMPGDIPSLAQRRTRDLFDGVVFVSSWQQTVFNLNMGIPIGESVIIRNAIEPIDSPTSEYNGTVRLVYHPTPHRGLEILVPVFEELCEEYDDIHLDVFSSFRIYARDEMDAGYEDLYERCRAHSSISYHGSRPNQEVRAALASAHVFAYPSIWRETSCMAAMEAMSARCITVAPDYGALPETLANFHYRYDWHEDPKVHSQRFKTALIKAIEDVRAGRTEPLLDMQRAYADRFYSVDFAITRWTEYLSDLKPNPRRGRKTLEWLTP